MSDLKPCPFCGGEAVFELTGTLKDMNIAGFGFRIQCPQCGAKIPYKNRQVTFGFSSNGETRIVQDDRPEAIETWNKRWCDE